MTVHRISLRSGLIPTSAGPFAPGPSNSICYSETGSVSACTNSLLDPRRGAREAVPRPVPFPDSCPETHHFTEGVLPMSVEMIPYNDKRFQKSLEAGFYLLHTYSKAPEASAKRMIDVQIMGNDFSKGTMIDMHSEAYLKEL